MSNYFPRFIKKYFVHKLALKDKSLKIVGLNVNFSLASYDNLKSQLKWQDEDIKQKRLKYFDRIIRVYF